MIGGVVITLGQIDRGADAAPFKQIARQLRDAIDDGRLQPGARVPSETELMEHYGVARMTVRQAFGQLRAEGLLVAEQGRGVFVRKLAPVRRLASERFARRHRDEGKAAFIAETEALGQPSVDSLAVSEGPAPDRVRELLRLRSSAKVVIRERRYLVDGMPVELATSYVPLTIAKGTAISQDDTGPGGIYARIEEAGHRLVSFTEEVTARMPTPAEKRALGLPDGTPVLTVLRVAHADDGPVEVTDTVKASPSFVLEYSFPAT